MKVSEPFEVGRIFVKTHDLMFLIEYRIVPVLSWQINESSWSYTFSWMTHYRKRSFRTEYFIKIVSWWSLTKNKKIKNIVYHREIIKYIRRMILYFFDNLGLPVEYTFLELNIYGPRRKYMILKCWKYTVLSLRIYDLMVWNIRSLKIINE